MCVCFILNYVYFYVQVMCKCLNVCKRSNGGEPMQCFRRFNVREGKNFHNVDYMLLSNAFGGKCKTDLNDCCVDLLLIKCDGIKQCKKCVFNYQCFEKQRQKINKSEDTVFLQEMHCIKKYVKDWHDTWWRIMELYYDSNDMCDTWWRYFVLS